MSVLSCFIIPLLTELSKIFSPPTSSIPVIYWEQGEIGRKAGSLSYKIKKKICLSWVWFDWFELILDSHKWKIKVLVTWSCLTLCDPTDCSPPGFSVLGILKARKLQWIAVSYSMGVSWSRDQTRVSCIEGRFFTSWASKGTQYIIKHVQSYILNFWHLIVSSFFYLFSERKSNV